MLDCILVFLGTAGHLHGQSMCNQSGRVTPAMYWIIPTALMNRECSTTQIFKRVGSSFRLLNCCRGTSGVEAERRSSISYCLSKLSTFVRCVIVIVFATRSRMISVRSAHARSAKSRPSNLVRMMSVSSFNPASFII